MEESKLYPNVEVWSKKFWKLFWNMKINREILYSYFSNNLSDEEKKIRGY